MAQQDASSTATGIQETLMSSYPKYTSMFAAQTKPSCFKRRGTILGFGPEPFVFFRKTRSGFSEIPSEYLGV